MKTLSILRLAVPLTASLLLITSIAIPYWCVREQNQSYQLDGLTYNANFEFSIGLFTMCYEARSMSTASGYLISECVFPKGADIPGEIIATIALAFISLTLLMSTFGTGLFYACSEDKEPVLITVASAASFLAGITLLAGMIVSGFYYTNKEQNVPTLAVTVTGNASDLHIGYWLQLVVLVLAIFSGAVFYVFRAQLSRDIKPDDAYTYRSK